MSEIEDLRARVAELELLLEDAVWVKRDEALIVSCALRVSLSEAAILVALWRAKHIMGAMELNAAVPVPLQVTRARLDPEFRTVNCLRVLVWRARRNLPPDWLCSKQGPAGAGYWLSSEARERLTQILAHD